MLTKNSKPGDQIILLLSLDSNERVPQEFSDLMPLSWVQIEERLKNGRFVLEQGFSRKMKVFLIAAATTSEMNTEFQRLIAEKKFGSQKGKNEQGTGL
jgi:hypothetical protein